MDRYAHVGVRDTAAAVAKLNLPTALGPGTELAAMQLTGTDDVGGSGAATGAAAGDEWKGRLRIADETMQSDGTLETLEFQPDDDDLGRLK